ncbi:serine/threonine-protein kinase ULK1-like [Lineus longissimus]|uniref:serine/threonine-protein kinase ULK1-like n=1 Tax=Lineus longissimus TaxID=88925 RepID=UPI00315CB9EA
MAFKLPKLNVSGKQKCETFFKKFKWADLSVVEEIGQGAYGTVFRAKCTGNTVSYDNPVVVKKVHGDTVNVERNFLKECHLLNDMSHRNVTSFIAMCEMPFAIMSEYECFDFAPFGIDKSVNNLSQWLCVIDSLDDINPLLNLFTLVGSDAISGLAYLHGKGVAHRDIKPANILISNKNYSSLEPSSKRFMEAYEFSPLLCKLTDFGESRSDIVQTNTVMNAGATTNVQRGSLPFMAPEILVEELRGTNASLEDLKKMDIWAMGMTLYTLINPDQPYPFSLESKEENMRGQDLYKNLVASKLRVGHRPRPSPKFEFLQRTKLANLYRIYKQFTLQDPYARPSAETLKQAFFIVDDVEFMSLGVSQATPQENHDRIIASALTRGENVALGTTLANDGTNACTFLALGIASDVQKKGPEFVWQDVPLLAVKYINITLEVINDIREHDRTYDTLEAMSNISTPEILTVDGVREAARVKTGILPTRRQSETFIQRKRKKLRAETGMTENGINRPLRAIAESYDSDSDEETDYSFGLVPAVADIRPNDMFYTGLTSVIVDPAPGLV